MVAARLVVRVHARKRCFIGDRVNMWQWTVKIEVSDIERRYTRHHVVLKVYDDVVRYSGIESIHEIMIAELRRGVHDRTDTACSKRIGVGKLIGQAFSQ